MEKIKAILFDMDGVIVDSEPSHIKTFNIMLKRFRIKIDKKYFLKYYTGTGSYHILKDIFAKNKIKADINYWDNKRKRLYLEYILKHGLKTVPGFKNFFKKLTKWGIKRVIVSGGRRVYVKTGLKLIGFNDDKHKFDLIITREDFSHRKPHPECFNVARKKLNLKPSECIVIEDAQSGVKAAKRAKMKCIALLTSTDKKTLKAAGADIVVKDFREIDLEILRK